MFMHPSLYERVHTCVCAHMFWVMARARAKRNEQGSCSLWNNKRLAEETPSTLNNQSSLLSIYNVLHYITTPLACRHLHIPVTSLQRLLIINGSHMLPGAPYYRVITATRKAKEKWKLCRHGMKEETNQGIRLY